MPNTKIRPSNIDMDSLSKALAKDYEFNQGQKNDVSHVADVKSEFIAKAATRTVDSEEKLVSDRDTVEKALYVYDPTDNELISANKIVNNNKLENYTLDLYNKIYGKSNINIANDIMSLREELYSLFNSLSKKGILNQYYAQNGFFDPFNNLDPRCEIEDICDIVQTGAITAGFTQHIYINKNDIEEKFNDVIENIIGLGQWAIVEKTFTNSNQKLYELVCILDMETNTSGVNDGLIDLTVYDYNYSDVGLNLKDKDDLYTELPTMKLKSLHGQYINNSYSFSKTDTYVGTGKLNEISFDDDSLTISVPAVDSSNNPAFAFSFRAPANKIGSLKTLTIYGNTTGNASDLRCYILKDKDRAEETTLSLDERYLNNDAIIIGRSKQVFLSALKDTEAWNVENKITFDFADESDGKYKISLENETYIIVIVKTNPEATGTWNLLCSRNPSTNNDVQTYNKLYTYHKNGSGLYVFDEKEYHYDLIYSIITEETLMEKEIGFTKGLYTSKDFAFDACTDVELTMVVNREGLFKVATSGTINGSNNDPIVTELDTSVKSLNTTTLGYNYGIKAGDTIVVGDKILTVKKENSDNRLFVNEDNIKVTAGEKIYKIGYKPHLELYFKYKNKLKIHVSIPMTLSKILPNNEKTIDTMSDKLVFTIDKECWPNKLNEDFADNILNKYGLNQLRMSSLLNIDDITPVSLNLNNNAKKSIFGNNSSEISIYSNDDDSNRYINLFDLGRLEPISAKIYVAWESTVPEQYFAEGEYSNSNFIGRIYNLVLSSNSVHGIFNDDKDNDIDDDPNKKA